MGGDYHRRPAQQVSVGTENSIDTARPTAQAADLAPELGIEVSTAAPTAARGASSELTVAALSLAYRNGPQEGTVTRITRLRPSGISSKEARPTLGSPLPDQGTRIWTLGDRARRQRRDTSWSLGVAPRQIRFSRGRNRFDRNQDTTTKMISHRVPQRWCMSTGMAPRPLGQGEHRWMPVWGGGTMETWTGSTDEPLSFFLSRDRRATALACLIG